MHCVAWLLMDQTLRRYWNVTTFRLNMKNTGRTMSGFTKEGESDEICNYGQVRRLTNPPSKRNYKAGHNLFKKQNKKYFSPVKIRESHTIIKRRLCLKNCWTLGRRVSVCNSLASGHTYLPNSLLSETAHKDWRHGCMVKEMSLDL